MPPKKPKTTIDGPAETAKAKKVTAGKPKRKKDEASEADEQAPAATSVGTPSKKPRKKDDETEETDPQRDTQSEADDEQLRDVLGAIPSPITGGITTWNQFCSNSAAARAAFSSSYGLSKVKSSTVDSVLYTSLFNIEGSLRVKFIEEKEKVQGIKRVEKIENGKKVFCVFLSSLDEKNKTAKNLEETRDFRAQAIGIESSVMAKIDAFHVLESQLKDAGKELQKVEAGGSGLPTLPVFADLKARAEKRVSESHEVDAGRLVRLIEDAEVQHAFRKQQLLELETRRTKALKEIKALQKETVELNKLIKAALKTGNQEEDAARGLLRKLAVRERLQESEADLAAATAGLKQVEATVRDLAQLLEGYRTKLPADARAGLLRAESLRAAAQAEYGLGRA